MEVNNDSSESRARYDGLSRADSKWVPRGIWAEISEARQQHGRAAKLNLAASYIYV